MFTLFERSEEFNQLNGDSVRLASSLLERLKPFASQVFYDAGGNVRVHSEDEQFVFCLTEGFVSAEAWEGTLFFLEPGQFLGFGLVNRSPISFQARSNVSGWKIPWESVLSNLQSDRELGMMVMNYVQVQSTLLQLFLSRLCPTEVASLPILHSFEKGEPIIIQETTPHEVFTMLHGEASAFLQDVRVGQIKQGDIFGAMAASENSARSASVIADTFCVVSAIPQDEFFELVKTHPRTMHQLVSTMSSIIISQNEKLLRQA